MNRSLGYFDIAAENGAVTRTRDTALIAPATRVLSLDPLAFVTGRLGFEPEPQQLPVFLARTGKGILCCNRQFGKSTVIAALAVHRAYTAPGSLLVVVAPTLRQSHELLLKIGRFTRALGIRPRTDGFNTVSLAFPNGSRIVAAPANADNIRGFSAVSMLLVDEAARVPDTVFDAATPMLARSDGTIWIMSTPKGRTGFFHDIWHGGDPSWTRVHSTAADCPRIPAAFLEAERASKPAAVFEEEYLCIFHDTDDSFFAADDITAAMSDEARVLAAGVADWNATTHLRYYAGLDLGKLRDHTAIAVLEHRVASTGQRDPVRFEWITETTLDVRHLERVPLRTPYDEVVARVARLVEAEPLAGRCTLAIDATGPGTPVLDQIRRAKLGASLVGIAITSGDQAGYSNGVTHVPKPHLIANLQLLFQNRRIRIADGLHEARTLRKELLDMRAASPHHGDLAMALALAAWQQSKGERK